MSTGAREEMAKRQPYMQRQHAEAEVKKGYSRRPWPCLGPCCTFLHVLANQPLRLWRPLSSSKGMIPVEKNRRYVRWYRYERQSLFTSLCPEGSLPAASQSHSFDPEFLCARLPMVPTIQNVSSWATHRQWKRTSVPVHCDFWSLFGQLG